MSLLGPRPLDSSFLPEDYLERKAESRTNLISIALFVVVTLGVVGAFFVTSRQWNDVKQYQTAVNIRYTQAAKDIEQLKTLEQQKGDLLEKAEVTTALIERVPKSILLAELVNRMPSKMTLLSIEVASTRLDKPVRSAARNDDKSNNAKSLAKSEGDKKKAKDAKPPVTAPRFDHKAILIGVARTHNEVARYVSNLQECGLLTSIDLIFSEQATIEGQVMNKFRVEALVRPEADARKITPMHAPRLADMNEVAGDDKNDKNAAPEIREMWRDNPEVPRPEPDRPQSPDDQEGN